MKLIKIDKYVINKDEIIAASLDNNTIRIYLRGCPEVIRLSATSKTKKANAIANFWELISKDTIEIKTENKKGAPIIDVGKGKKVA